MFERRCEGVLENLLKCKNLHVWARLHTECQFLWALSSIDTVNPIKHCSSECRTKFLPLTCSMSKQFVETSQGYIQFVTVCFSVVHTARPSPPNKTSSSEGQWRLSWKQIIFGSGSNSEGRGVENWIRAECCHSQVYQLQSDAKRSSDITADELKKMALSRIFICNFQFRWRLQPDNRLQPVSAIAACH